MVQSSGNISRADAEAVADQLLELLSHLVRLMPPGIDARKIFSMLDRVRDDPDGVRREVVNMIMSGAIMFDDFASERATLQKFASSPRRILDEVKKELPPGQRGRPATVVPDELLEQSAALLLPICRELVLLRSHSRRKRPVGTVWTEA